MKQKILIFILAALFIFTQTSVVFAKGARSSGGSRSFSTSKSSGYSGSSSSKSSGSTSKSSSGSSNSGYTGSTSSASSKASSGSSSGYSGSSSKKSPSASSPARTSSGTSSSSAPKTSTAKTSYMQQQYKQQVSSSNYKTYQRNLNADQQKAYNTSTGYNYRVNNRMDFDTAMNTRSQRISSLNTRPTRVNYNVNYFGGGPFGYGSAFIGPWDMMFIMVASDLFWHHHWNEIYAHRDYFNAADFAAREKAMQQHQNTPKDPNYLDPDVDPDLQFSQQYQEKNVDKVYYTNKHPASSSNTAVAVIAIILIAVGAVIIIRVVSRRKIPKKPSQSDIY